MASFRAALGLRPRNARALFHLGNAQFALQAYAAAEEAFESALKVRRASSLLLRRAALPHTRSLAALRSSPCWWSRPVG